MAKIIPNYQLADGNDNAVGLTAFPEITDANGVPFLMPRGKGSRNRGVRRDRLDCTQARVGKDSIQIFFTAMTLEQYHLLLGTYEGLVTVKISLTTNAFANYNAVMVCPDEEELTYVRHMSYMYWDDYKGPGYRDVPITLRKLEAL